jgi:hypothetical protein
MMATCRREDGSCFVRVHVAAGDRGADAIVGVGQADQFAEPEGPPGRPSRTLPRDPTLPVAQQGDIAIGVDS